MFNAPQTYADDNAEVQKGGSTPRLSSPKSLLLWLTGSFNRSLLVFKLFYFFFFAAFGSLFPLISIYFKQLGLNATQCGVLSGIRSLVECFGAPFWSSLAEKWKKAKEFFIFSLLCWIAFNLAVGFVRPTPEGCLITLLTTPSESVNLSTAPMAIAEIYRNYRYDNVKAMEMDRDVSFPSRDRIGQTPLLLNTELLVDPSAYVGEAWTWGQKVRSRGKTNYAKDLPRFHDPERYPPGSLVMPLYSTVVYSQSKINQIFVVLLLLILVGELFSCPAICLADSCVLLHLEDDPDNTYGKQRMLGSVGWGLMMLFIGIVLDNSASFPEHPCLAPGHRERNYMICFAMFSVLMSCALITATQFTFGYERGQESMYFKVVKDKMARTLLGRQTKNRSKLVNEEDEETPQFAEVSEMAGEGGDSSKVSAKGAQSKPTNEEILERQLGIKLDRSSAPQKAALTEVDPYAEDLASTAQLKITKWFQVLHQFSKPRLASFLFVAWFMGLGMGQVFSFLFWHMQELGGSPTLFGIASVINHISEILAYYFSKTVIDRIGHTRVLYCGLLGNVLRFLYISWIANPWWILPFELLQGLTHAGVWAACCSYLGQAFTPEYRMSTQGLLQGLHHGLGRGIGSILGGVIISFYGSATMFRSYGAASAIILIAFLCLNYFLPAEPIVSPQPEASSTAVDGGAGFPGAAPGTSLANQHEKRADSREDFQDGLSSGGNQEHSPRYSTPYPSGRQNLHNGRDYSTSHLPKFSQPLNNAGQPEPYQHGYQY